MLADSVREVIALDAERVERPPQVGARVDEAIIKGIARKGDEFIIVLDIDEAFKARAATGERVVEPQ